jgi:hypothetical protein
LFKKYRTLRRITRSRLFRVACLVLAPSMVMLSMATGSASASWRNGEMFNFAKQQCMDGGGGWLSTWSCNGSGVQIWTDVSPDGVTWYQFRDGNGQCVDWGQNSGLYSCNGGDWQQFYAHYVGNVNGRDWYVFRNGHTNSCMDGGQPLLAGGCSPNNTNTWQWWSWN